MKNFIKTFDELNVVVKILLALPFLDIIWVVYRLIKSIDQNNTLGIVLAVLLLVFGVPFLWLIDIITLAISNKVLWFE